MDHEQYIPKARAIYAELAQDFDVFDDDHQQAVLNELHEQLKRDDPKEVQRLKMRWARAHKKRDTTAIDTLREENNKIRTTYEELREKYIKLHSAYEDLQEKVLQLHEENEWLREELRAYVRRYENKTLPDLLT
jgi:uncharacterized protein involved in exopolysaccharide biosynthesis